MLRADPRTFDSSRSAASSRASEAGPCRDRCTAGMLQNVGSDVESDGTVGSDGRGRSSASGLLHDLDARVDLYRIGTPGTTSVAS